MDVTPLYSLWSWSRILRPRVRKDREHLLYQCPALFGREVSRVDGLFLALESTELGLLGEVTVYNVDDGVDLLTREPFTAAEQLAPHSGYLLVSVIVCSAIRRRELPSS